MNMKMDLRVWPSNANKVRVTHKILFIPVIFGNEVRFVPYIQC